MKSEMPSLTIIGDVGVDLVLGPVDKWPAIGTERVVERSELRAGGSAGNTAQAVSYLGGNCRLLSLVGNDDFGSWLRNQFKHVTASLPVCRQPTSVSVGVIHACDERSFFTTNGHLQELAEGHILPFLTPAPHDHCIALLCGVFLTPKIRATYSALIDELISLGYSVALDTGWPTEGWTPALRREVNGWIEKCDHVLLNELEVTSLANNGELTSAINTLSEIMKPSACLVVKTGAKGALGCKKGWLVSATPKATQVFDTIGAGDSFNAGYLLARLEGRNLAQALEAGCRSAGAVISRFPRRNIAPGELAEHHLINEV